ncbi:MAG: hypothetical protein QM655_10080 [Nocardioidaceae bacterium]
MKSRLGTGLAITVIALIAGGCGSSQTLTAGNTMSAVASTEQGVATSRPVGTDGASVANSVPSDSQVASDDPNLPPVIRVRSTVPVLWDNLSTLAPLPSGTEVTITEDDAFRAVNSEYDYFADPTVRRQSTVLLGLLSDFRNGLDKPDYWPAYILVGGKGECAVGGPPMATNRPDTVPCVVAMSVNAQTGALGKYSMAENPPPLPAL